MTLEIFLFILNFVQFALNLQTCNLSTTILYNPQNHIPDNITVLRTKRYYTRWGGDANSIPTVPQFLVKVYDEEAPTSQPQSSLRPTTAFLDLQGKLQLGSVKMSFQTQSPEPAEPMSYSRFIPPKPESAVVKGIARGLAVPENFKDVPFPRLLSHLSIKRPHVSKMTSDPVLRGDSEADDAIIGMFDVNDKPKMMPEDESALKAVLEDRVLGFPMRHGEGLVTPVMYNRRKMPAMATPNRGYHRLTEDSHFVIDDFDHRPAANRDEKGDDLSYPSQITRKPIALLNHISHPDLQNVDDIDVIIDDVKIDAEVDGEEQEFEFTRKEPGVRPGTRIPDSRKPNKKKGRPPHEPKKATHSSHRHTEDINIELFIDKEESNGRNEDVRIDADVDGEEQEFDFTRTEPDVRPGTRIPDSCKPTKKKGRPPHEPKKATHSSHRHTEDINIELYIDKEDGENGSEDVRIDADVDGEEQEFEFTHTRPGTRPGTGKPNTHKPTMKVHPYTRHPGSRETEDINIEIDGGQIEIDAVGEEKTVSFTYSGHTTSPHDSKVGEAGGGDDDKGKGNIDEPNMYLDNEETDFPKQTVRTSDQPKGSDDYKDVSESSDEKVISSDEIDTDREGKIKPDHENTRNSKKESHKKTKYKPTAITSIQSQTSKWQITTEIKHIYDDSTDNSGTTAIDKTLMPETTIANADEHISRRKFMTCNVSDVEPFTFLKLHKLDEVMGQIRKWGDNYPVAKTVDIANGSLQTYMGNTIIMLIVDDRSHGQDKTAKHTVLIVAGIQGRDHHSVAAAMYLLYELIERGEHHTDLLTKYRFWVIPILNPDGYEYSMSFPNTRNWRKNLRQTFEKDIKCEKEGFKCITSECKGVNLDRNFDYQWVEGENASQLNDPCSELYPGPRQLSEPETRMLTRYLYSVRVTMHSFIALKEGDVLGVMFPYSHTKNERATDSLHLQWQLVNEEYAKGLEVKPALYAGGIEDWVEGHLGVDNSYSITLNEPNNTDITTIEQVCHEAFAAIDTLLLKEPQQSHLSFLRSAGAPQPQSFSSLDLECCRFKLTDRICSIPWLRMFVCYIQLKLLIILISNE